MTPSRPRDHVSVGVTSTSETAVQDTILVVQNEVFVRMVICDYLRGCGYKVIEAANADEALVVLQNPEIPLDVVVTDIETPGAMDGFALSRWIRTHRPELDVLLTGSVPRAVSIASDLCDEGPLPRPYDPQVMVDRIRRLTAARATRAKRRN
jgi:CheY-like chemotaxis protein